MRRRFECRVSLYMSVVTETLAVLKLAYGRLLNAPQWSIRRLNASREA